MLDTISLVAIITASGALLVSVLTHIRHSQCWCFSVDTTTPLLTSDDHKISVV